MYDFCFQNPTEKKLNVSLFGSNDDKNISLITEFNLPKFGSKIISLRASHLYYHWLSKMPVCRPVIFEYTDSKNGVDIFHG